MALLQVDRVFKKQGADFLLQDISMGIEAQQRIAIAGETGSGKTTLMKIIAGLGQAFTGDVFFEGKRVKALEDKLMPGHPGIAYISQHFEMHNNYWVRDILSYANDLSDSDSEKLFSICRITHLLGRKTNTLSGGEKQRVGLARLLTLSPRLLLLDEPFSNNDLIHKTILKSVINEVIDSFGIACVLVSHDPSDILPWAQKIFVMRDGGIVQHGTPAEIYKYPADEYCAGLFGPYNMIPPAVDEIYRMVRPENVRILHDSRSGMEGIVSAVGYFGSYYDLDVEATETKQKIKIRTINVNIKQGDKIRFELPAF
jgi:ABC-type sulfate/molybdate transport systems ATPase subunit